MMKSQVTISVTFGFIIRFSWRAILSPFEHSYLSPLQPKSVPVTWIHEVSMMSEGFTACQERMGVKVKELEEYYSSYGLGRFPG